MIGVLNRVLEGSLPRGKQYHRENNPREPGEHSCVYFAGTASVRR